MTDLMNDDLSFPDDEDGEDTEPEPPEAPIDTVPE